MHNLTTKQLNALRWFMEHIEKGKLEESFFVKELEGLGGSQMFIIGFRKEIPDYLNTGIMNALVEDRAFIRTGKEYTVTKRAFEIISFDFESPNPSPAHTFIKETYKKVQESFDREELKTLCFELQVNPDWVFGDKADWPFYLLQYLYRQNRLKELPSILSEKRPNIDWPAFPEDS